MKSRQPRAELRVQSIEDDGWTWTYVEPEHDIELYSNEVYASAEHAKEWARRAYPDVPFAEDAEDADKDAQDPQDGQDAEG